MCKRERDREREREREKIALYLPASLAYEDGFKVSAIE